MTKKLYSISVIYDIMVVADETQTPEDVARSCFADIVENEEPKYNSEVGSIYEISSKHDWYDAIPYGDTDGNPAQYYTTQETRKRRSRERVVKKIKDILSNDEWENLKVLIKEGVE